MWSILQTNAESSIGSPFVHSLFSGDMTKVLVVAEWLRMGGGVTRTLLSYLDGIDYSQHDVTLLLIKPPDASVDLVPPEVSIQQYPSDFHLLAPRAGLTRAHDIGGMAETLRYGLSLAKWKVTRNRRDRMRYFTRLADPIAGHYDVAVAYTMMDNFANAVVAYLVEADRKILWCHIDTQLYAKEPMGGMGHLYAAFDAINCVGESTLLSFAAKYPDLSERLRVAYNPLDIERIRKLAREPLTLESASQITLCTVARLTYEKGIDLIVEAASALQRDGLDFVWWVVGPPYSHDYSQQIRESIDREQLSDRVILIGQVENPYPFMAAADIYVQPSRIEGYCTTTVEARVLHRAIIRTDIPDAREQFEHGVDGLIAPLSAAGIYQAVHELAANKEARDQLSQAVARNPPTNTGFIEQITTTS